MASLLSGLGSLVTRTTDRLASGARSGDDNIRGGVRKPRAGGYRAAARDASASRTRRTYAR